MWHAAKDHSKINEGEGKEKYGTIDKRLKSQAFHVCIQWVQIPLVSPLEFGRTLHNKQKLSFITTTSGATEPETSMV